MKDVIPDKNLKILVVDDSSATNLIASRALQNLGYQNVITANSGNEAFRKLKVANEDGSPIEVVFSDWIMPDGGGLDLLEMIRKDEKLPNPFFVMVSATSDIDEVESALVKGADDYLIKPITQKKLLIKLSQYKKIKNNFAENTPTAAEKDKLASRAVASDQTYLKTVLASMNDYLVMIDFDGFIIDANKKFCDFAKISARKIAGHSIRDFISSPDVESDTLLEQLTSHSISSDSLVFFEGPTGSNAVTISSSNFNIVEDGLPQIIICAKDIQKESELKSRLEASQKWTALGEMASGIAHEVNNPLAIIHGYAESLENQINSANFDRDSFAETTKQIKTMSVRISKVIRGLRAFARDATDEPFRETSIEQVLKSSLDLCSHKLISKDIEILNELADVKIQCREIQLSQVFINLLSNASDAISSFEDPDCKKWIKIESSTNSNKYIIRVSNSGPKISSQIAERIMEPFFTTKEIGKGTGLGLSISKGIIEMHGGSLSVDLSQPHTTFVIELNLS